MSHRTGLVPFAAEKCLTYVRDDIGVPVKEMIGGFEYWVREGLPDVRRGSTTRGAPDPLTAPEDGVSCAC